MSDNGTCQKRNELRSKWYESKNDADKMRYRSHLRTCPACRADLDAQFARLKSAQYPDVDWETLEIRSHYDPVS